MKSQVSSAKVVAECGDTGRMPAVGGSLVSQSINIKCRDIWPFPLMVNLNSELTNMLFIILIMCLELAHGDS